MATIWTCRRRTMQRERERERVLLLYEYFSFMIPFERTTIQRNIMESFCTGDASDCTINKVVCAMQLYGRHYRQMTFNEFDEISINCPGYTVYGIMG